MKRQAFVQTLFLGAMLGPACKDGDGSAFETGEVHGGVDAPGQSRDGDMAGLAEALGERLHRRELFSVIVDVQDFPINNLWHDRRVKYDHG